MEDRQHRREMSGRSWRTLGQAARRRHTHACMRAARSKTMVIASWTGAVATAILAVGGRARQPR